MAAIGVHDVDLVMVITGRDEGDLAAVGRPGRIKLVAGGMGQADYLAPIGIHDIHLVEAITMRVKDQVFAIGRPGCDKSGGGC